MKNEPPVEVGDFTYRPVSTARARALTHAHRTRRRWEAIPKTREMWVILHHRNCTGSPWDEPTRKRNFQASYFFFNNTPAFLLAPRQFSVQIDNAGASFREVGSGNTSGSSSPETIAGLLNATAINVSLFTDALERPSVADESCFLLGYFSSDWSSNIILATWSRHSHYQKWLICNRGATFAIKLHPNGRI